MKPDNAEKVEVSSGISAASLLDCDSKIRKKLDPEYKHSLSYVVKIPSQQMSYIIPLMYSLGYQVELDFTYSPDEWSLTGYYYDKDLNYVGHTIWCPGA